MQTDWLITAIIIIGIIVIIDVVWRIVQWSLNNAKPIIQVEARIVEIDDEYSSPFVRDGDDGYALNLDIRYIITFELLPAGNRKKLNVPTMGSEMLATGDVGTLTLQGTRFISFKNC